jgi:hypothetical protein
MVYLLSRTAKLLADLNDASVILSEKPPEAISLQANDEEDDDALVSLDTIEQITNMSSGRTAELWDTAKTLLEDIERWLRLLKRERTEHERVYLGNLAYANTMKVSCRKEETRANVDAVPRSFCFTMFSGATGRMSSCKSAAWPYWSIARLAPHC